ncbi:MAG: TetR/AcrR family transcriptional regulator [Anaerolineae bacterium]|nr:TetR/AcrR family transcriptional regulator [Anaerolineae bacterium]
MSSPSLSTHDRILETTWHLMEKNRGQGVDIADIAKAAGVSRQSVYLHFKSRTELLIATTRYLDTTLQFNERIQRACEGADGILSLEEFVEVWGGYIPEIYGLARALLYARETDIDAAAAWDNRMKDTQNGLQRILGQVEQDGQLAPDWSLDEAVDYAWAMVSIRMWENLTIERGWTQQQYIARTQQTLKRMLLRLT